MAVLKSYTCSKCAGVLVFDSDQKFFDCPFCGTRFNAVDFHGEEIISQAQACLEQKEFSTAQTKFKAILADRPHNFTALQGLVFSTAKASSVNDLQDPGFMGKCNMTALKNEIEFAQNNAGQPNAGYFDILSDMADLVSDMKKYEKEKAEITSARNKPKFTVAEMEYKAYSQGRSNATIFYILFGAFLAGSLLLTAVSSEPGTRIAGVILSLIVIGIGAAYVIWSFKKDDKDHEPLRKMAEIGNTGARTMDSKISGLEMHYKRMFSSLKAFEPQETDEEIAPSEAQTTPVDLTGYEDTGKKITCAKCGAQLALDKEKRVFECSSCGVAYGVSLFFGMPLEKAMNSMNTGFYAEAEDRFSHMLMADPSDFEALLGRILCMGRWTKISDINPADEITPIRVKQIQKRVTEAKESAAEEDKQYFDYVRMIIFALDRLLVNKHKQKVTTNELDIFDAKRDLYAAAEPDLKEYYRNGRRKIQMDLQSYTEAEPGLKKDLEKAVARAIEYRSDSALTK